MWLTEDDEEVETGGVETVKLTLIADAHDDGLDAHERRECVLVRELRDQAAGAGGVRELRGVGVGEPCFFDFAVAKEGEKLEVTRFCIVHRVCVLKCFPDNSLLMCCLCLDCVIISNLMFVGADGVRWITLKNFVLEDTETQCYDKM